MNPLWSGQVKAASTPQARSAAARLAWLTRRGLRNPNAPAAASKPSTPKPAGGARRAARAPKPNVPSVNVPNVPPPAAAVPKIPAAPSPLGPRPAPSPIPGVPNVPNTPNVPSVSAASLPPSMQARARNILKNQGQAAHDAFVMYADQNIRGASGPLNSAHLAHITRGAIRAANAAPQAPSAPHVPGNAPNAPNVPSAPAAPRTNVPASALPVAHRGFYNALAKIPATTQPQLDAYANTILDEYQKNPNASPTAAHQAAVNAARAVTGHAPITATAPITNAVPGAPRVPAAPQVPNAPSTTNNPPPHIPPPAAVPSTPKPAAPKAPGAPKAPKAPVAPKPAAPVKVPATHRLNAPVAAPADPGTTLHTFNPAVGGGGFAGYRRPASLPQYAAQNHAGYVQATDPSYVAAYNAYVDHVNSNWSPGMGWQAERKLHQAAMRKAKIAAGEGALFRASTARSAGIDAAPEGKPVDLPTSSPVLNVFNSWLSKGMPNTMGGYELNDVRDSLNDIGNHMPDAKKKQALAAAQQIAQALTGRSQVRVHSLDEVGTAALGAAMASALNGDKAPASKIAALKAGDAAARAIAEARGIEPDANDPARAAERALFDASPLAWWTDRVAGGGVVQPIADDMLKSGDPALVKAGNDIYTSFGIPFAGWGPAPLVAPVATPGQPKVNPWASFKAPDGTPTVKLADASGLDPKIQKRIAAATKGVGDPTVAASIHNAMVNAYTSNGNKGLSDRKLSGLANMAAHNAAVRASKGFPTKDDGRLELGDLGPDTAPPMPKTGASIPVPGVLRTSSTMQQPQPIDPTVSNPAYYVDNPIALLSDPLMADAISKLGTNQIPDNVKRDDGGVHHNAFQAALQLTQGFNTLPHVITKSEYDKYRTTESAWARGVNQAHAAANAGGKKPLHPHDETRTGVYYAGNQGGAAYGNGTYIAAHTPNQIGTSDSGLVAEASVYGRSIAKGTIKADARVTTQAHIVKLQTQLLQDLRNDPSTRGNNELIQQFVGVPGQGMVAIAYGYDGYHTHNGSGYFVLVNRGAIRMMDTQT